MLLGCACAAHAQQPPEPAPALDLREEVQRIPVTVKDRYGRQETRSIAVTIFRPAGPGPFPLVILNHGRATPDKQAQQRRARFEPLSRYLVQKGFAVLLPTRVGYADTYGDFDPEYAGSCNAPSHEVMSQVVSDQVLSTLEFARSLPDVDASRWIVMGQSMGGFTAIATVARNPPGLLAGINFAGGANGDPEHRPGQPCGAARLEAFWHDKAASAKAPMLWLYWENDRYWGPEIPKRWHQAWINGGGQAEFHSLPAVGQDGHSGSSIDMNHWVPIMEAFLARLGFQKSGLIPVPKPSGFASLYDLDQVPMQAARRNDRYSKFLAAPLPRAYAIGPKGEAGYAQGDWAAGRALGFCQARNGAVCKLYAVDNDVVWLP